MMNGGGSFGGELKCVHIAVAVENQGQRDASILVGAVGGHLDRFSHLSDFIRWPELPNRRGNGRSGSPCEISRWSARPGPTLNHSDFMSRETPCAREVPKSGNGFPGWHEMRAGDGGDLGGMTASVVEAEKSKRRRLTRAVTLYTVLKEDGRDGLAPRRTQPRTQPRTQAGWR